MKKIIKSREYDITLNIPLRGLDKLYKDWNLFIGDIIRTPLGEGMITGKTHDGKKVGVIVKLKNIPEKPDKRLVKKRFLVLRYKDLKEWNLNLSKQGESILVGTVRPVNQTSTRKTNLI